MDLWHRIREKWEQDGLQVPSGVTAQQLEAFEERYSVALPASMRTYFQVADGNSDMGNDYFTFWPLREVKLVSEELTSPIHTNRHDYPQCFIFADYLLWCWAYAVRLNSDSQADGPVYLISGKEKTIMAASFLEFMQKYVVDPDSLI